MSQKLFTGTGYLTKLMMRQNRFKLFLWLVGLIAVTLATAVSYPDIYPDEQARAAFVFTMENPAMIAMLGVGYEDYATIGALFAHEMLLFTAIAVAIMNILLVGRSTRADEEDGRVELIRSLPVGRLAYLNAAAIVAVVTNVLVAVLIGTGIILLGIDGMSAEGAYLYGAILGATGLVFAGFTALFSQLSETSRGSTMLSFGTLIAAYLVRASGDVSSEALSLVSPLGWTVRTEVFVENYWWPVYAMLAVAIVLGLVAFYLNAIRDLESGFIPERAGKRNASAFLQTTMGLAFRLQRTNLIAWAIGIFLLSASFGAILGDLEVYFTDNEFVQAFLAESGDTSMMEQFIVLLMAIMALISTVPVVMAVMKLKSEENKHLTENYYSRAVSRSRLLGSYVCLSMIVSFVMQALVAIGLWSVGMVVVEDGIAFDTTFASALVYLPAMWILMGVAVFLIGIAPKATGFVWLYVIYSFVVIYLGGLLEFPEWANNLSAFHHIPQIPTMDMDYMRVLILVVIAIVLTVIGFIGYNRRGIQG
ncbi:ABC transporter permease [Oceanobacillus polygoni]|uniref:ABC-2 type transport system permease protein n=1 Tax=Oceanobacillus polygoni TaxID=1235259 RepID=A0A9X0Z146_9BACI|nr:ABC transporter permease [Oceanobacillus polygoni]MBP2079501.1 ABC-2 type transport system permease protein [Oceanobacillus polygoni]